MVCLTPAIAKRFAALLNENKEALANPEALDFFRNLPDLQR